MHVYKRSPIVVARKVRLFSHLAVAAVLLQSAVSAAAQQPTPARDSVYRQLLDFRSLVRGGAIQPQWMADGRSFWYVEGAPAHTAILKVDPAANTVAPLFDAPKLRAALTPALGHEPPYDGLPFTTFTFVDGERAIRFAVEGRSFRLDLGSYAVTAVPVASRRPAAAGGGPASPVELPAPGGRWAALIEEHSIALRSSDDQRTIRLTTDGSERFPWVLQLDPRQGPGAVWSPNGTHLLAAKVDRSAIHFMPVVHWLKANHEEITWEPYSATGEAVERTELYVIDARSGKQTRVDVGEDREQLVFPLGWSADGVHVHFARLDRLMKRLELVSADARTGDARVLLTERQETFIDGLAFNPANVFFPFTDGARFVWRSERDGWSHLYLYDGNGSLLRRLTTGKTPVDSVVSIDEKAGWVYYLARGDTSRPYDVQLYRVDLEGKRTARLTEATGVHAAAFAPRHEYFLDTHSTIDRPPRVELRRTDGTLVRLLATADASALERLGWRAPTEFTVKAADGTTALYGALYVPNDFDPARRYPVVDLQYMGNFVHSAPHSFVGSWLGDDAQSLAQLGFVVYIVDARGTPGRGKAFQDHTYGNVGRIEVPDHVATLRQLASTRPYMDTTRVGITGYSWGGYFTLRALLTAPEIFKVGVAGAPVVDFIAHPRPIEAYMGLPQENAAGYEQGSNIPLAHRLQGKLLIAIGTADVNVTFNHSMRMADAFIKAGKFFDLIVMPGETHALTPAALAYYREARNRYLVEHLRAGKPESDAPVRGSPPSPTPRGKMPNEEAGGRRR